MKSGQNPLPPLPITLPQDQFGHTGAPTEWWWHIGTLKASDGRVFGFEVNATGMSKKGYMFAQIEITDVNGQCNYQKVNPMAFNANWAQYDNTQPWFVNIPGEGGTTNGSITMKDIDNNPLNMAVEAIFTDTNTNTPCAISLQLFQEGAPLMVWGTGSNLVDPTAPTPIAQYNYYYSLTHLQASGTITIGSEVIQVTGLTWMDHEYGAFPSGAPGHPVIWTLQDFQLDNNLHLSNFTTFGVLPQEGVPIASNATLLYEGQSVFLETVTTAYGPTYVSKKGVTYFMKYVIQIKDSHIYFVAESSYPDQLFVDPIGADVWEGVATGQMYFQLTEKKSIPISAGPAWIEQDLN